MRPETRSSLREMFFARGAKQEEIRKLEGDIKSMDQVAKEILIRESAFDFLKIDWTAISRSV